MRTRRLHSRGAGLLAVLAAGLSMLLPATTHGGNGVPHFYVPRQHHHIGAHQRHGLPGFHRSRCASDVVAPRPAFGAVDLSGYVGSYGMYTGAPRDEASLIHLGGEGPYSGMTDIINRITGAGRGGH